MVRIKWNLVYFRKGIVLDTTLFFLNISFRAGAGKAVGLLNELTALTTNTTAGKKIRFQKNVKFKDECFKG